MSLEAIAKQEYSLIDNLQRELHFDHESRGESISSIFYKEFRKTSWYAPIKAKLNATISGNEITASIDNTAHYLKLIYKIRDFPQISVRKDFVGKVEIAWCHNHGYNDLRRAQLYLDKIHCQTIDNVWCDIWSQFFTKAGFDRHTDSCVGNLPHLEGWSQVLPAHQTSVILPFYHCRDPGLAIPIFYFKPTDKLEYRFSMLNSIKDLLRMRVMGPDGKFVERPVDLDCLETSLNSSFLPTPEFWGEYANLTDDELDYFKCQALEYETKTKVGDREITTSMAQSRVIYTEDVGIHDSSNPSSYGDTVTIPMDSKSPTKAIFPVAQNITSSELNNLSNYTTDNSNLYAGWNPISQIGMKYAGMDRFPMMNICHFDKIEVFKMTSAPRDPGYSVIMNWDDLESLDAGVGVCYGNCGGNLNVKLADTNPFSGSLKNTNENKSADAVLERLLNGNSNKPSENKDKFIIRVRTLNTRKLTISRVDSGFKIKF